MLDMQKCVYLKKRSKKGELFPFCSKTRKKTTFEACSTCLDKCYKKYKPINKKSKKKRVVTPETYASVYIRDNGTCQLCFRCDNTYDKEKDEWVHIEEHHIIYKSEDVKLINEPSNLICLCTQCHKKVHSNKKKWQLYLLRLIKKE